MNKTTKNTNKKLLVQSVFIWLLMISPAFLYAGQTADAQILNYSNSDITIEYREVSLGGTISWVRIGDISKKKARLFRNITIGSVLRAKSGSTVVKQFTVESPSKGSNKVVISVRNKNTD